MVTEVIYCRVQPEIKAAVAKLATESGLSHSAVVEHIVAERLGLTIHPYQGLINLLGKVER